MPGFIIYGSGSIGCVVGGALQAAGAEVTFITRPNRSNAFEQYGLSATNFDGASLSLKPSEIKQSFEIKDTASPDAILLCVKSMDTKTAAINILKHIPRGTPVFSLQNGLDNASVLREILPDHTIVSAMVAFNVVEILPGKFQLATDGELYLEHCEPGEFVAQALSKSILNTQLTSSINSVQWGKLLLNLNNGLNALSGLPLLQQLEDRNWRLLLSACIKEALNVAHALEIEPAQFGKVRPKIIPSILKLPNWAFKLAANQMLRIDPSAKTSMAHDLEKGRKPEIDYLNGKIVEMAEWLKIDAPTNRLITQEVHRLFEAKQKRHVSAMDLLSRLKTNTGG